MRCCTKKNVTRAAERVFISQPAMSAALQKLREFFEDPLLVRVGRDMQLTPRGFLAPIKLLPVPFATPDTHEVVIWHKRNEPDPGHAWLREVLIAAAQPQPAAHPTWSDASRDAADDPP
jgi:DNA-binding transcriptional LysR family regulator